MVQAEFNLWYADHQPNCGINFDKNPGAMEVILHINIFIQLYFT